MDMRLVIEVRKAAGLKKVEMARALDMSRQNYERLEKTGQLISNAQFQVLWKLWPGTDAEFKALVAKCAK